MLTEYVEYFYFSVNLCLLTEINVYTIVIAPDSYRTRSTYLTNTSSVAYGKGLAACCAATCFTYYYQGYSVGTRLVITVYCILTGGGVAITKVPVVIARTLGAAVKRYIRIYSCACYRWSKRCCYRLVAVYSYGLHYCVVVVVN